MVLEKNNTKWMVDKGNRGNFVIEEVKENNKHVRCWWGKDNKIEEEEEERNYWIIVKAQEGERVS